MCTSSRKISAINEATISEEVVRPTLVEVNLDHLTSNYLAIKNHVKPSRVMPVLKANAYGHGLVRVAHLMQELNADYLGVAVLEEGMLLRQSGITLPILVLGGILGNQVPFFLTHNLSITASSIAKLQQIQQAAEALKTTAKVHLKIDTGMERIGVHYYNADAFLEASLKCPNITIEGVFSHLANADAADLTHARLQLERFLGVTSFYEKHSIQCPVRHIANSGGILQLPEAHLDMVRPGIMLYGVLPSSEVRKTVPLKPALSWKSRVVYFKVIQAGDPVGYGSTWKKAASTRAVTVPVGYGDGYFRSMSNKAQVLIRGTRYPEVGTFSMDQIVVDIGDGSAYNNDEVILIGSQDNQTITCEELAEWAGTIPYEILTNINTRVPRIYTGDSPIPK